MKNLTLALTLLATPLVAQDQSKMVSSITECAASAENAGEMGACVGLAATICREGMDDPDPDYIRIRCENEEFGIWMRLVNEEAERAFRMAADFENRLYEQDNSISPDYLQFADDAVAEQKAWLEYTRSQCYKGAFADQLQRIEHEDPVFCMVPRVAQRIFELQAFETHLVWREE